MASQDQPHDTNPVNQRTYPYAEGCAWVDGEFLPIGEARIPILDSGFTRSDVTYDVAAVWNGRFFRLDDHLDRILRGCEKLRLQVPKSRTELREIMLGTVRHSGLREAYVELVVTRGVPGPGERDPRGWTPRVYAYAIPYVWIVDDVAQERGVDAVIARNTFRIPDGAFDQTVKNFMWGDLIRGLFEAYDRNASQAILLGPDGLVTEGPGFNVFMVKDGVVRTPAKGVLEGITRRTVLEIVERDGRVADVADLVADDLLVADEIFFTSTAGGIMPVATLDGRPVGSQQPGPVTTSIKRQYWELHHDAVLSESVDYATQAPSVSAGA